MSKYKTITWNLAKELIFDRGLIIPANPEYVYETPRLREIIEQLDKIEYARTDLHAEIMDNVTWAD